MTLTDSDLSDLLAAIKAGEMTDTIRTSLEWVLQQLIEAEATAFIGAARHERTDTRTAQRNGHRPRLLSTTAGDVELAIPKLREGSFGPAAGPTCNGPCGRCPTSICTPGLGCPAGRTWRGNRRSVALAGGGTPRLGRHRDPRQRDDADPDPRPRQIVTAPLWLEGVGSRRSW